jgi:hypothetical protein
MSLRLLVAAALFVASLASTAAAAPADDVTLRVDRFVDQFQINRLRFSGVISSGAANEYVAVMHRRCGQTSFTAIGGATTSDGGAWEATPMFGTPPTSGTFRAQWKGEVSKPVTVRSAVRVFLNRPRSGRHVVRVIADANLSGRFVALQRLAGGRWTHVRRARLSSYGSAGFGGGFEASFKVRKRGLTLRFLVPQETAAPCHLPAASRSFVS